MQTRRVALLVGLLLVVPVLVGLGFSASLLADYLHPLPVFCEVGGGCDRVRASAYSHLLGVPVPVLGLVFFAAAGALVAARGPRVRLAQLALGTAGAVVALAFVWIQKKIVGTFCPLCMVVDTSAVVLWTGSFLRWSRGWDPPLWRPMLARGLFAVVAFAAIAGPLLAGSLIKPNEKVPLPIAEEMRKTPADKVCVVDFVDFECPFCRMTNEALEPVLAENASHVRLVRKMVPLHSHVHAMDAARAACCGERLGKGEQFATALFRAEDLTPEGCERLAGEMGVDLAAYRACIADPAIDQRIKSEQNEFKAAKGHGLPTIWFDGEKVVGATERPELENVMRRALAGKS